MNDKYFMPPFQCLAIALYPSLETQLFNCYGCCNFSNPFCLASMAVGVAIIYLLSALMGSLTSSVFVKRNPAVGSSGALFGLLGAMLAGLIRNWKIYIAKVSQLLITCSLASIHLLLIFLCAGFSIIYAGTSCYCQLVYWFTTIRRHLFEYWRFLVWNPSRYYASFQSSTRNHGKEERSF